METDWLGHAIVMIHNHFYSVQFRPRFCIIDVEYSILTQDEIILDSYIRKKSFLIYKNFQCSGQ